MRGISLAAALLAAALAAGCGDDSDDSGSGPAPSTFTLTIQSGITGGKVVSTSPASVIDCGEGASEQKCSATFQVGSTVVLEAQPSAQKAFLGWTGDCSGVSSCTLTMAADRSVGSSFGDIVTPPPARAHENWASGALHGAKYAEFKTGVASALQCTSCHGADLSGEGDAVSCTSCHHLSVAGVLRPVERELAFANGPAVTASCLACHPGKAAEVMQTLHWTWKGPTPQLYALADFVADPLTLRNPGTIGKANLVNNFCVAVPSNEKRCDQCHAGYGGDPDPAKPQKSARAYTAADSSIPLEQRVDCLICHSDLTASGYSKITNNFGNPPPTANLAAAAKAIIRTPARENCGFCHFYAGGGDNVKLMGSALKNPTPALDVHMGNGMTCARCHAEPGHTFKGAGIHVPANTGRSSCEDCHGATPHSTLASGAMIDRHTDAIACQTCHIPAFSRGQFAKVDWDWSTAGDKTRGTNGVVKTRVNDRGEPDANGTEVTTYDYIKGDFVWQRNVKPTYAWYNGSMVHVTTSDKGAFAVETGLTSADSDRITLGAPLGSGSDATAKIFPFKLMRGRQAVYVDGTSSFVITPNVFGPAGFWGVIQSAGYTYDPAARTYTAPAAATPVMTATPIDSLWSAAFTNGSIKAGQLAAGTPTLAKQEGTGTGWAWRYTKLYMDLNHEVAPKAEALGAGGGCADCHSASSVIDWAQLGYACSDPMLCAKRP